MPRKRKRRQEVKPVPGQTHGEATNQERRMEAVESFAPAAPIPPPVHMGSPTQRPDEPVMSGVSVGPGPGPEALPRFAGGGDNEVLLRVQALYQQSPNEHVRRLLEYAEQFVDPSVLHA